MSAYNKAMHTKDIHLPISREQLRSLRAGDEVELFGVAYMVSVPAHELLASLLKNNEPLPFSLFGASFYYSLPGEVFRPFGPNTCLHVDAYTPLLVKRGVSAMIGRGDRIEAVRAAMFMRAVYFIPRGGAEAVQNKCAIEPQISAFPNLKDDAIRRIFFMGLPAVVGMDSFGGSIYFEE